MRGGIRRDGERRRIAGCDRGQVDAENTVRGLGDLHELRKTYKSC